MKFQKEFCQSLIKLCEAKLQSTLPVCRDNDLQLAHLIDETILFEKEIQVCVPDYSQDIGCLKVLLTEENLKIWVGLEKRCMFCVKIYVCFFKGENV